MKKIKLSSKNVNELIPWVLAKRNVLLAFLFGGFLIYCFDVIYNNAYIKLEYVDYSSSIMMFDGKKESNMINRITDNLRQKEQIIKEELDEKHKDIFIYNNNPIGPLPSGSEVSESESVEMVEENKVVPVEDIPASSDLVGTVENDVNQNPSPSN